ncbi:MAG: hypothetical protein AAGE52_05070 [Myxococcota bacterium]
MTSNCWISLLAFALAALAGCGDDAGSPDGSVDPFVDGSIDGSTVSCDTLFFSGECPEHRICTEEGGVATCEAACEEGFVFSADGGTCTEVPNCNLGSDVLAQCESENRACVADDEGASCGDCAEGFRPSPTTDGCIPATCGGRTCDDDEFESFDDAGGCTCEPRPCEAGEASSLLTGRCIACSLRCNAEGESGLSPVTDSDGNCVCDTTPGFFWPGGDAAQARHCDEDSDRWINRSALDAIESSDPTISGIAQRGCDPFRVEGVALRNEYAQELFVWSCAEGLVSSSDGASSPCASRAPMPLVEPDRNDSQEKIDLAPIEVPAVATVFGGRAAAANELNAVTKLCVDDIADYDGDGTADIAQAQRADVDDIASRWAAFSHFSELHRLELPVSRSGEFLTIAERSRCALGSGFPLEYEDPGSDYAFECARQRDARFSADEPLPGFDFARFSCDEETGSCPIPAMTPLELGAAVSRPHGLCTDPLQLWGDVFRGMHHHSQFKCVQFSNDPAFPYERPLSAATEGEERYLDFQRCHLESGSGEFDCDSFPVVDDEVGWGAARYEPGVELAAGDAFAPSNEVLGCIDEAILDGLCPSTTPVDEGGRFFQFGDAERFGELICGCPDTERLFFRDVDGDGHGDPNVFVSTCLPPTGFVALGDDCEPSDPDVSPSQADEPDEFGVDSNCDGIDGTIADAVFVSALFGNDANTGLEPDRALPSIADAITIAQGVGRSYVLIAEGQYDLDEPLQLASGVNLVGGYRDDATFATRRVTAEDTSIVGTSTTAMVAAGISEPTTVADLTVLGPDRSGTTGEGPSIALVVLDTPQSAQLAFLRTRLEGRAGSDGSPGSTGGVAEPGHAGGAGNEPPQRACGLNAAGENGQNAALGGRGGGPGGNDCNGNCTHSAGRGGDAASGQTPSGTPMEGFRSDNRFGRLQASASGWFESIGSAGADGLAGGGGGGGGGGGALQAGCGIGTTRTGGRGGNGGDGGDGGAGGGPGGQGGASIGVILIRSVVDFAGSTIVRGQGGAGGRGGNGGQGGDGGQGECGRNGSSQAGRGGHGGGGGAGRAGGGGAGGNGGPSIGIAFADSPILTPFLGLPRQENTGAGGSGGGAGQSGAAGRGRANRCSANFIDSPGLAPAGDAGLDSLGVSTQELDL